MTIQFNLPASAAGVGDSGDLNQTKNIDYNVPAQGDVNDTTSPAPPGTYATYSQPPILLRVRRNLIFDPILVSGRRKNLSSIFPQPKANVSDSISSSDTLTGSIAFAQTLADSIVSSDLVLGQLSYFAALSDTNVSSDYVTAAGAGSAKLKVDGFVRKTLVLFVPGLNTFGPVPVFPTLPQGFPIKVSPVTDTIIGTTKSLREMRVAQQTNPIWDIEIVFEELLDATQNQTPYAPFAFDFEYENLVKLWLSMYGTANVFAFLCPWDFSRENQTIGVGDGISYVFPVYYSWGIGAQTTLIPVGQIQSISSVTVGGTPVSGGNYTFNRNKIYFINSFGYISPPASGAEIVITLNYYYLCRFTEDEQDYEEFGKNRWTVSSLKFRASPWI